MFIQDPQPCFLTAEKANYAHLTMSLDLQHAVGGNVSSNGGNVRNQPGQADQVGREKCDDEMYQHLH